MTLMPVSNIWVVGSSWSKEGGGRWISHSSSTERSARSASRQSPRTFQTWPRVALPTGIVMPLPRLRTAAPRVRPSVGRMAMARTRLSPICWATSALTAWVSPSMVTSNSRAVLISGRESRGNSASMTGPAMATTLPSFNSCIWGLLVWLGFGFLGFC